MKRMINHRSGHGMSLPSFSLIAALLLSSPIAIIPGVIVACLVILIPRIEQIEMELFFVIAAIEVGTILGYCGNEFYRTGSGFHALVIGYILFSLSFLGIARYLER